MLDDLSPDDDGLPVAVSIGMNADSLATCVIPALAGLPRLSFRLAKDDQTDNTGLISRGEAVAAITTGAKEIPGCDWHDLGAMRYLAEAQPAFAEPWFAEGVTAAALEDGPTLAYDEFDRLHLNWASGVAGRRVAPPQSVVNTAHGLRDAALAGLGWVLLPHPFADPLCQDGALVGLAPDRPIDVTLRSQVLHSLRANLDPLTRQIRRAARTALVQTGG